MKKTFIKLFLIFILFPLVNIYSTDSLVVNKLNEYLPVAYYSFDGNANDISGNGNDGNVLGAKLTEELDGDSNKAYYFDGIDDNINVGIKPSIQISGDLTISFWIKIDSLNGSIRSIINCQADNTDDPETNALYSIYFQSNKNYLTYTHESGMGINQTYNFFNYLFNIDIWYHVVLIRNILQRTVILYVNGKQVDKIYYDENPGNGSLSGLRIGKSNGTVQPSCFKGVIDELYLYDKIINYNQLLGLYESYAKIKTPTNLVLLNVDSNTISLTWDDNSDREDGYEIERKINDQIYQLISIVNANQHSFKDYNLEKSKEYYYRVRAFKDVEFASHSDYSNEVCTSMPTFTKDYNKLPINFELFQNYPNPFNPTTTISYQIPEQVRNDNVILKVYDVLGKLVKVLVNETQKPGNYSIEFNGSNLTSGIYYYTVVAGDFSVTKKMLLIK